VTAINQYRGLLFPMGTNVIRGARLETAQPACDLIRIGMRGQKFEIAHLRTNRHIFTVDLDAFHAIMPAPREKPANRMVFLGSGA
jgi:hypothetical protein